MLQYKIFNTIKLFKHFILSGKLGFKNSDRTKKVKIVLDAFKNLQFTNR